MSETNPNEVNPNPYAPGIVQKKEILNDVEEVRKQHLPHEASVKSIGILFIIGGLYGMVAAFTAFSAFSSMPASKNSMNTPAPYLAFALSISVALALLVTAFGIRKLKAWSRIPAAVLAGFGLLVVPVGTLINAYILFLLLSKKGSMVFSPAYKEVIEQTPHMRYKTSVVALFFIGLIVVAIIIAVFALAV